MKFAGMLREFEVYTHAGRVVMADPRTGVVTDPLPSIPVVASGQLSDGEATAHGALLATESFLGPHALVAGADDQLPVPSKVAAEARRALRWAEAYGLADAPGLSTARTLASSKSISMRKVRQLAEFFAANVDSFAGDGFTPGSEGFPSQVAIAYRAFGGKPGHAWVDGLIKKSARFALVAAYLGVENAASLDEDATTDSGLFDPTTKHMFTPTTIPLACGVCLQHPEADVHDDRAVDYSLVNLDPDDTHFFSGSIDDPETCDLCAEPLETRQHTNAVVAHLRKFRNTLRRQLEQWAPPADAATTESLIASLDLDGYLSLGYDPELLDYDLQHETAVADGWVDGAEYYAAIDTDDPLVAVDLFMSLDSAWSRWDAFLGKWVETAPDTTDVTLIDLDDETAEFVLAALTRGAGSPCDMRDADPAEALLVELALEDVDWEFLDRAVIAGGEYTPEERADNAKQQVRDKNGRFAVSGSRVVTDAGTVGIIRKIDPDTQRVQIEDDKGASTWVDAKTVEAVDGGTDNDYRKKIDHIRNNMPGQARAVDDTPKAWLPNVLPALDKVELAKIVNNFPAYVEEMRGQKNRHFAGLDPEKSDVPPIYMAVVDELDKAAVLDLIALVPASATSTDPKVLLRTAKGWEESVSYLRQLKSATPPPVVKLDDAETVKTVTEQIDSFFTSSAATEAAMFGPYGELLPVIARGSSDVGNAERLRQYWLYGRGGAKIRWGTPGDWTRCYRHLKKYMGPRAKGYCANLHKRATGTWPGDKNNVGKRDRFSLVSESAVMALAASAAQSTGTPPVAVEQVHPDSSGKFVAFNIPTLAPVGVESGDGRFFSALALSHRNLPLPLMWQTHTQSGHDSSVIVGRIDSIDIDDNGSLVNARGVLDSGSYGKEAERLIRNGFLRGVSVDLDDFEATTTPHEAAAENADQQVIANDKTEIRRARVMGATLVAKPAFQECYIELADDKEASLVADGQYAGFPANADEDMVEALMAEALIASAIPVFPPTSWFSNPSLQKPTPLTITDDGRVFGHIAAWHVDHIGLPAATKPPRSRSKYAYFHTGSLMTEERQEVPVGQLTLVGGHAPLHANATAAAKHYDDTNSAFADVHAGEDAHGIWVAGALRPSVSPEQIRAIRASAPSGDWRPIQGRLELVAVCAVNVPGFPIARTMVASGAVTALVAAGAQFFDLKDREATNSEALDTLAAAAEAMSTDERARFERLRDAALTTKAESAKQRMAALRPAAATPDLNVAAAADAAKARFAQVRDRGSDA